jgi:hypothetical protein
MNNYNIPTPGISAKLATMLNFSVSLLSAFSNTWKMEYHTYVYDATKFNFTYN